MLSSVVGWAKAPPAGLTLVPPLVGLRGVTYMGVGEVSLSKKKEEKEEKEEKET
jgi:hypothetical protein